MTKVKVFIFACLLIALSSIIVVQAQEQATSGLSATDIKQLISDAQTKGVRVIIVDPESGPVATEEKTVSILVVLEREAVAARTRLIDILKDAPNFYEEVAKGVRQQPALSSWWPLRVIGWTAIFLAVGWAAERLYSVWIKKLFAYPFNPKPRREAEKIAYLYTRGGLEFIGLLIQVLVAALLVMAFDGGVPYRRQTAFPLIGAFAIIRLVNIYLHTLLAPNTPTYRLVNIDTDAAKLMIRDAMFVVGPMTVLFATRYWLGFLGVDQRVRILADLLSISFVISLACAFVIRHRTAIAHMILGADDGYAKSFGLRLLARTWHVLALSYLLVAWAAIAVRLLLEQPNATGFAVPPLLLILAGIALYGAGLLVIESIFGPDDRETAEQHQVILPEPANDIASMSGGDAAADESTFRKLATFRDVAKSAAAIISTLIVAWLILDLWGLDLANRGGLLAATWDILLVAFLTYLGWGAIRVWFDRKIAEEGGGQTAMSDEGGGGEGSRLGTLLPLFRNSLLILLAVMAGMIILSEMGVNIAPLFAGAGIVGVAIGFGSQTLVRDVLSGAFFLMDDAFRKGEYIDLGDVKGTVENISIRSMKLRHHLGPLNTVPFGEIKYLTNYSRDWVIMKLPLRVTYDTDVERVRKLIKNLGQDLLQDPEIGDKFMEPVKSQGVIEMDDSAMIIRVKFMTRPGEQWVIRKRVYAEIRELFEREGIKFAHREVTVHVADVESGNVSSQDKSQVAAAGAARIAFQDKTPSPANTDRN